ncbi:MAG: acetyl-CoA C-acyltransferase [Candidatus Marinimicrobia bacterium]|nr:acetyl-CoA C-acyltransferase [Candidatus Neomarinimicrobiota bacterium]
MFDEDSIRVAIVGGIRTPFVKANTAFKKYTSLELGTHAVNGLIERFNLSSESVDELVYGWVIIDPRVPNVAREIVFNADLPSTVRAHTVSNNCITGIHAITSVYDSIREGRTEIGIAGGVESMSNPPVMFGRRASRVFLDIATSKSFGSRLAHALKIRPGFFKPNAPAIEEPSTGLSMGEHTELMAKEWKITREEQDNIALMSHMNAHKATEDGRLKAEIFPIDEIDRDLIIRSDTTMEKLGKLKPVFDKGPEGTITAGNSSPLTDGASAVLLMSDERAKKEGFEPLAYIKGFEYSAINTSDGLLMAPAVAVPRLLKRTGLSLEDMDIIEMHEAFGAQVTSNLRAWENGWKEEPIGKVDMEKLNPLGSSIAVGHPFAATGGRIVTTLSNEMKRREAKYGLVSICAAGAMAAAMILERN